MNANGGAGKVIKRMQPLMENAMLSKSQMMACRHGDGKSWWLLKQAQDTNVVHKFLFREDGTVTGPVTQGFAEPHFTVADLWGQSVFSQDGDKYGTSCLGSRRIFISDFDRCTGDLSNPKIYLVPELSAHNAYDLTETDSLIQGMAFSPNGRFIYVATRANIHQLDLWETNPSQAWLQIAGLDTTWDAFRTYCQIGLGLDDKLYIGNWGGYGNQMSIVEKPNLKGKACSFHPHGLSFPLFHWTDGTWTGTVMSPPNMANYKLGSNSTCGDSTTSITSTQQNQPTLYISPNPTTGIVTINYSLQQTEQGFLLISDMSGKIIDRRWIAAQAGSEIFNISKEAKGIYICHLVVNGIQKASGKIVLKD